MKAALPTTSEKDKEKPQVSCNTAKFKPFTHEEFAKATYGSNKYWFAKHHSNKWDKSFPSRFLDQAARCLSLRPDDPDKKEADQLLDAMRNDPDFYTEEMLKKACQVKDLQKGGRARTNSTPSSVKENVVPHANSRLASHFTNSEYDDDDDVFRSDGVIVETPTEARGIKDDGDDESHPARATHVDGNYTAPSNLRLSTVYEESDGKKAGIPSLRRPVCVDPDSDDDDDYADEDDYHDTVGHEFGKEGHYDDYRGEYDGIYNDY